MKTKLNCLAACVALCAALAGCSMRDVAGLWSTPEARINAAVPLADPVRNNHAWLLEATTGAQKKDVEARFDSRLKLRALNCAQGYAPSFFASADEIRRKVGGSSCFAEADAELARWTGLLRAGIVLARPPLKPVPRSGPAFVLADGFISGAVFAAAAPVALLDVGPGQTIQVVDIETSRPLLREPAASSKIGQLSPNGRLFTVGDNDRLRIRDSETGAVVAELPLVRWHTFHWLDNRTAIYNRSGSGAEKPFLIDFASGKEVPIPWLSSGVQRATAVAGADNQYVVFSGATITKIAFERGGVEPSVSAIADKQSPGTNWALNTSGTTSGGSHFFGTAGSGLRITDLATLEVESVALEPFNVQLSFATADPDKVIVTGYVNPTQGEGPRTLLYSIGTHSLAPVDATKVTSQRFVYVPALRKQGVIVDRKIELMDALPTQAELPLAQFTAQMQDLVNQRKLAAFERQQAPGPGVGATGPSPIQSMGNAPLADLARDAQVEAVGVYQGAGGTSATPGARRTGYVEVRVRRSTRPVILVLSSYEPVRWMVITESGARVAAVLVSGYYPSQVVGAGSARIIVSGSAYAYKQDSAEFQALNRDVARMLGKGIGLFQGRYEGGPFSVGGI
jgi:hypothetical protein